jgi:hypothetical protein
MSDANVVHNSNAGFGVIRAPRSGRIELNLSDRKVVEQIWARAARDAEPSQPEQASRQ